MAASIFSLIIGGSIYLFWRAPTLRMFDWIAGLGLGGGLANLRYLVRHIEPIPWVLYSAPDGAWTFTGTVIFCVIWRAEKAVLKWCWVCLIPLLAVGGEAGQYFEVVPGRFDHLDLLTCLCASALAIHFTIRMTPKNA